MANIDLVIRIPEECYKQIQKHIFSIAYDAIKTKEEKKQVEEKFNVVLAIKNGTPLPKGHGRLGDIDKLIKEVEHFHKCPNGHSDVYDEAMIINFLDNAPTIIKADKESEG